jgi:trehalose synthase
VQHVNVDAVPLNILEPILGPPRFQAFTDMAGGAAKALSGTAVVNVNSTATGGGVAEMLPTLLAYARAMNVDARWLVVEGNDEYFAVTKRIHNRVYGVPGDDGDLGDAERKLYEKTLATQQEELLAVVRRGDVVVLHDPQTLGLARVLRKAHASVVWRCHIGADAPNKHTEQGWQFLSPYLEDVDRIVVSRDTFAPPGYPGDQVRVIPPSIDPLAVKNGPLTEAEIDALLSFTGLVQGRDHSSGTATFHRRDGSPARVDHQADVLQLGPPPPAGAPLVVQVSRWDRLKDMPGVLTAFAEHVDGTTDAHLILAGPNVSGVSDDPEGAAVYEECAELWRGLPHSERRRVHLACLPTNDTEENAAVVNALQRRATVVTQKSIAEGFGLTVVEAMWKARPVVATAVGGIVDQIDDPTRGTLIEDPTDLAAFGAAVRELIEDPERAAAIGAAAQERARDFLPDVHLALWADLLGDLIQSGRAGPG